MADERVDALVIGAGLAGLYMLQKLRLIGLDAVVLETGDDFGGTWYWDKYPGARCDFRSHDYSHTFSAEIKQDWSWSELYAEQPAILRYIQEVAHCFDLQRSIRFGSRVLTACWEEGKWRWHVTDEAGTVRSCRFLIIATGCLSEPKDVSIPDREQFRGDIYPTAHWPHEPVDFRGLDVAVVGTDSSGIQVVPVAAQQARMLTVIRRTPAYCAPARNRRLGAEEEGRIKAGYADRRPLSRVTPGGTPVIYGVDRAVDVSAEQRTRRFDRYWSDDLLSIVASFADIMTDPSANESAAGYVRARMLERLSNAPDVATALVPTGYSPGSRRPCYDTGYLENFAQLHVELIDAAATPIRCFTADGLQAGDRAFRFDAVILATGFDAMTGALLAIDPAGAGSIRLRDRWSAGPVNLPGLMAAGFPNMFTITGPGSPSVMANTLVAIEQHVEWIARCLSDLERDGIATIEAEEGAQRVWVDHVNAVAAATLFMSVDSRYLGANMPGKPRVFMPYAGGLAAYRARCTEIAAKGYRGFRRRRHVGEVHPAREEQRA